jgi:hypothetical protein
VPARSALQGPFAGQPLKIVDPVLMLEQADKWSKLYESIFLTHAR